MGGGNGGGRWGWLGWWGGVGGKGIKLYLNNKKKILKRICILTRLPRIRVWESLGALVYIQCARPTGGTCRINTHVLIHSLTLPARLVQEDRMITYIIRGAGKEGEDLSS